MELIYTILEFIGKGGWVLWWIGLVLFLMWTFLIERYWYIYGQYPKEARSIIARWNEREDQTSWKAKQIRDAWISIAREALNQRMLLIKTLIAICPLLGLLGTVTGMIDVFDGMSGSGSGSARQMAGGIFKATIPTMAGMVAALSGIFFSSRLEQTTYMKSHQLADNLSHH